MQMVKPRNQSDVTEQLYKFKTVNTKCTRQEFKWKIKRKDENKNLKFKKKQE